MAPDSMMAARVFISWVRPQEQAPFSFVLSILMNLDPPENLCVKKCLEPQGAWFAGMGNNTWALSVFKFKYS